MKEHFDGNMETRGKPVLVTIEEQLRNAAQYQAWRDAGNRPGAPGDPSKLHGVKRTSILNRLPYWKVCASNRNASGSFIVILVRSSWLRERTTFSSLHYSIDVYRSLRPPLHARSVGRRSITYLLRMSEEQFSLTTFQSYVSFIVVVSQLQATFT
jgi:hypothetical protein